MKHGDLELDMFNNSVFNAFIAFSVLNCTVCLYVCAFYDIHNKY